MKIEIAKNTFVNLAGYGTFTYPLSAVDLARLQQIAKHDAELIARHFIVSEDSPAEKPTKKKK